MGDGHNASTLEAGNDDEHWLLTANDKFMRLYRGKKFGECESVAVDVVNRVPKPASQLAVDVTMRLMNYLAKCALLTETG